jgi:phage N-6-adenine-methyltransferase
VEGAAAVFSSARSDWRTPPTLWKPLAEEFAITLDVCASKHNAIVPRYIGPDHHDPVLRDATTALWGHREVCWMNPPFSRDEGIDISPFVQAAAENAYYNTVIALVPARTDTRWWHRHIMRDADEVRLIPHRVKFLRPDGSEADSAAFPSAVVIWRPLWNVRGRVPRFVTWDYL